MIAAAAVPASLPVQWQAWKASVPITTRRTGIATFTVPLAVQNKADADLGDLRIIDSNGSEMPYMLVVRRGSRNVQWREAALDDYGFVPSLYTQVVADAGTASKADYTTLELSTPKQHFATSARVFASDDRRTWRLVRDNAPLFSYQDENLGSNLRIALQPQHSRWYRIEILDSAAKFPIDGVRFANGREALPELARYPVASTTVRQHRHVTLVVVDTGIAHLPVSFVRMDTISPRFSRDVELEYSDDGQNWNQADAKRFERTPLADRRTATIAEAQGRFWRLSVANGNDKPVAAPALELWGSPRHIFFAADRPQQYRLIFRNAEAPSPTYDFAATHTARAIAAAGQASAGTLQPTSPHVRTIPWTEKHPWLLWLGLSVGITAVGGLALSTLREPGQNPQAPGEDD